MKRKPPRASHLESAIELRKIIVASFRHLFRYSLASSQDPAWDSASYALFLRVGPTSHVASAGIRKIAPSMFTKNM